ncbi:hypothetical protein JOB18_038379 [Solea senegalensis]|uniref:Arrestin C-terminal-like domain-containing protein n=1 Tax=Solea senegalensis TaxID=28829 RepID=A0AAV6QK99_SOLSE|nr:arrestin domain-containing protein 3-like [Solea senegalensis]KAG7490569.1 hypothetical protein JOB18_038379 [Solea senegalensis]KAG7490570.1 hypothetical protein JOB18_038379 [Solea senegalensis]
MFSSTFKNFNINFNALNAENTVTSGDVITGHVSFDLAKPTKISLITMTATGKAHVHWSTGGGGRKRRSRRHFTAKLEFFNLKSAIVQGNAAVGGDMKLQPGKHMYPFTCQLPHGDFPSSFTGIHGNISYSLTVSISRPWHFTKDFETKLNFVHHYNANQPDLRAPLSGTNQMTLCSLWCASPRLAMTVTIEKKAFVPGETVKISCNFSSESSRTATPKVKLIQKHDYYTDNKLHRRMYAKTLASVTDQPIDARTRYVQTDIMLTIPSSAVLTISNCSILVLSYWIEVSLSVCCARDLIVMFPIILCDTPVYTEEPPVYS